MPDQQNYRSHRRFYPPYHFVIVPILAINMVRELVTVIRHPSAAGAWSLAVATALLGLAFVARINSLTVQNRLIRLEETLRLTRLLPDELQGRIPELSTGQLIALRFCDDAELPGLTRAILDGEVREPNAIKQRIKRWRPDFLRV